MERIEFLRGVLKDFNNVKGVREKALRELRGLEREYDLDITYPNGYNKS